MKYDAGVSKRQVLRELGYTEEQIDEFEKEREEAAEMFGLPTAPFPAKQPDTVDRPPTPPERRPETEE